MPESPRLLSTGELAKALGVSRGAVLAWVRRDPPYLVPTFTLPSGHHRFDLDDVRRQLAEHRKRIE